MTQNYQAVPERSSRAPYVGAVAFFFILILVGIMFLDSEAQTSGYAGG